MPCNVEVFQHRSGLKPKRNLVFLWIGKETQGKKKKYPGESEPAGHDGQTGLGKKHNIAKIGYGKEESSSENAARP
jgi:hypothetical protein